MPDPDAPVRSADDQIARAIEVALCERTDEAWARVRLAEQHLEDMEMEAVTGITFTRLDSRAAKECQ